MEPTTRSSGASGTPPRTAACGHDVARSPQLLEEILGAFGFVHLHPAPAQLEMDEYEGTQDFLEKLKSWVPSYSSISIQLRPSSSIECASDPVAVTLPSSSASRAAAWFEALSHQG